MADKFKVRFRRVLAFLSHPTLHRWADLSLLTLVSLLLVTIGRPEINDLSKLFCRRSAPWSSATTFLFLALLSWTVSLTLIRLGALNAGHFRLRSFLGFPPVWISALAASLLYFANQDVPFHEPFKIPIRLLLPWFGSCLLAPIVGVVIALATNRRGAPRRPPVLVNAPSDSMENMIRDPEHLLMWLQEEKPVDLPSEDVFGFSVIARRVASILRGEKMRTVGVVGPFGTGKTSLLNLTEYYLQNSDDTSPGIGFSGEMILCRVHGWGRIKGSIAERVLTIALERLSEAIDCSAIISLPSSYRRAIGGMHWPGGPVLEALLETSHDPVAQLKKLDRILVAAGLRLVILLEDLDRNTADEIIRDEIPSLLDRLRGMTSVSFVLAIGTEHQYSAILIRICDYVEAIA